MTEPTRVAVVTDRIEDAQALVIQGIESVLRPAGVSVLVVVSHRQHRGRGGMVRRLVNAGALDGAVLLPLVHAGTGRNRVSEVAQHVNDIPAVTVGVEEVGIPGVGVPEASAAREVVEHLSGECGRRTPLLVSSDGGVPLESRRSRALAYAALARGITLQAPEQLSAAFDRQSANERLSLWLAAEEVPGFDSVVCGSDEIGVGVLEALAAHGLRVPDDVVVLSYGNTPTSWSAEPALTSVDERLVEQGARAGRYLLGRLRGGPDDRPHDGGHAGSVAAGGLVVRASSAPDAPREYLRQVPWRLDAESQPTNGDAAKEESWQRAQQLDVARSVYDRSEGEVAHALADLNRIWLPRVVRGDMQPAERGWLATRLAELVESFPEPVWWRAYLDTLGEAVQGLLAPEQSPLSAEVLTLRVRLSVEEALQGARGRREAAARRRSTAILEMNRALVGCTTYADLDSVLLAFLPRLGLGRCFVAVREEVDPAAADDDVWMRLVLRYGEGSQHALVADPDRWRAAARFPAQQLLPEELRDELGRGTLVLQPLFVGATWYGILLYEQAGADRYVDESLRIGVSRVLEAKARNDELTSRSAELASVVASRTAELQVEVASRRQAQEELREANERLRYALLRDGLTGLYNRPAFDEHLERAWRQMRRDGQELSVLMCDVDHFKLFNDVSGHLAGDDCLRRVAKLIEAAAGRPGDMVARFGGEEFVVVLGDTDLAGARTVAERVVRAVREADLAHPGLGERGRVTVSVGAASSGGVPSAEALVGAADRALYIAKAQGRDCAWSESGPAVTTPTP